MILEFYTLAAGSPLTSASVVSYQPFGDCLRFNSHWHALILEGGFNPALGENVKLWDALQFIALATQFIPPQGVRLLRYFGLYSSRSRWKWPQWDHLTAHAPQGWK